MKRAASRLLIAAALVFAQQGVLLHALSHLGHDLAVAEHGEKGAPPLNHSIEVCVAFHAVGSALPNAGLAVEPPRIAPLAAAFFGVPLAASPRIEFDSRAPPLLA